MATKNIEVLAGEKPASQPEAGKIGHSFVRQPEEEVGGRYWVRRRMECYNCGGISWVDYDTNAYHSYVCCYCGAINTL
ncbi:MAG: hypothetical protein JO069_16980 [Verrucomicrobia bacterium]|nr:hypothetical protein [Verrucomicrobiota bacterium]